MSHGISLWLFLSIYCNTRHIGLLVQLSAYGCLFNIVYLRHVWKSKLCISKWSHFIFSVLLVYFCCTQLQWNSSLNACVHYAKYSVTMKRNWKQKKLINVGMEYITTLKAATNLSQQVSMDGLTECATVVVNN